MKFLQSRIAEWFSRGLNNGPNLMHSCKSTSLCLFKMKIHINVCTDHCCADFFSLPCKTFVFSHEKTPWEGQSWLTQIPQCGQYPRLGPHTSWGSWHEQVACPGTAQANRFCWLLLLGVATAALNSFSYVISTDLGWTCAESPSATTW